MLAYQVDIFSFQVGGYGLAEGRIEPNGLSSTVSLLLPCAFIDVGSVIFDVFVVAIQLTKDMKIHDRIRALPLTEAFITIKDHKQNFKSHPKFRLFNPNSNFWSLKAPFFQTHVFFTTLKYILTNGFFLSFVEVTIFC